jgi:hypothetical protein
MNPELRRKYLEDVVKQLADESKGSYILLLNNSIGETAIVCALLKAFKQEHKSQVTIVTMPGHLEVIKLWADDIDKVVFLDMESMRDLTYFGVIDQNAWRKDHPITTWTRHRNDGFLDRLIQLRLLDQKRGGVNLVDAYRLLLRLSWRSQLNHVDLIRVKSDSAELESILSSKPANKKFALLFPGCNTNIPAPQRVWQGICLAYLKQGYEVFYCTQGARFVPDLDNLPAKQINLSVTQAVTSAQIFESIVSHNTGLMSLFLLCGVRSSVNILLTKSQVSVGVAQESVPLLGSSFSFTTEMIREGTIVREWETPNSESALDHFSEDIAMAREGSTFLAWKSPDKHGNRHVFNGD